MNLTTIYNKLEKSYKDEVTYLSAVKSFFYSLKDVSFSKEELNIINKIILPNNIIVKDIIWYDDNNEKKVNKGFRIWHNNTLGVYKGGIRFNKNVNIDSLKALAFEQTFKNSLSSLPLGGAKGGSDFDPKDKSTNEIKQFTQSFMIQFEQYFNRILDVPAGDLGVGPFELGIMFDTYLNIHKGENIGFITGKPVSKGGSLARIEATGYGLCYMVEKALKTYFDTDFKNKNVVISGSGNVGINAAIKAFELGANIIGMSDSKGYIYNEQGINPYIVKEIKENKNSIKNYILHDKTTFYENNSKKLFLHSSNIILPCATFNEIDEEIINQINFDNLLIVAEGANRPLSNVAINKIINTNKTLFIPGKAANAGGVCVSYFEMLQNDKNKYYSFEQVDEMLKEIMNNIFNNIYNKSLKYKKKYDLLFGANLYSLKRLLKEELKKEISS